MKNSTTTALHHAENAAPSAYDGPKSSFIINYVTDEYNCLTFASPDIGGIGVVLSAVIQTVLTTTALIAVICLDYHVSNKELLEHKNRGIWWRNALRAFIRVSGDTALITALALLLAAYVNLPLTSDRNARLLHFQDAYFTLCTYICCAFSSIHLASLLVLRERLENHPRTTYLRMTLLSIFGVLLTITISLSRYAFEPFFVLMQRFLVGCLKFSEEFEFVMEYFLPAALLSYLFWLSIYQIVRRDQERRESRKWWQRVLHFATFGNRKVCLVVQVLFAGVSVTFIMLQKFTSAPIPTAEDRHNGVGEWCSLSNEIDDQWGFPQACSMILLLIPFYAAGEASCEDTEEVKPEQPQKVDFKDLDYLLLSPLDGNPKHDIAVPPSSLDFSLRRCSTF